MTGNIPFEWECSKREWKIKLSLKTSKEYTDCCQQRHHKQSKDGMIVFGHLFFIINYSKKSNKTKVANEE